MSEQPTLTFAGDHVLVTHKRQSEPKMARILGREQGRGVERVYLDTRVHTSEIDHFGEWWARGAITTILEREVSTVAIAHNPPDNVGEPA